MLIGLIGNQNCGKTTLFNALTGSSARIGNFPGITAEYRKGQVKWDSAMTVMDLPGVYSLTPYSEEEQITKEVLKRIQGMLNVADASNLARHLYLTLQLTELGLPVVLAVNMMDEAKHIRIDFSGISALLGIPVIGISARKRYGLKELTECLKLQINNRSKPICPIPVSENETYESRALRRYQYVEKICCECIQTEKNGDAATEKIDRMLLHSGAAFPVLFSVLALLLLIPFGPLGTFLQTEAESAIGGLSALDFSFFPVWFQSFLREGVLNGAGSVFSFFPCIFLLFFTLSLLEDSGYLARISFLADKPMQTIGLSGRSVIPFLTGFGCSVPAVAAAKTLSSDREKRLTVLCLPFLSCSAKLPVYLFLTKSLFPKTGFCIILFLYLSGILWGILNAAFSHCFLMTGTSESFVLELPRYRIPDWKYCFKYTVSRSGDFIKKTCTIIFLSGVFVWLMQYLTPLGTVAETFQQSILFFAGQKIASFFSPLGFGTPEAGAAILSGIFAKEAVVSTLRMLTENCCELFTPLSAFSFLHFVLLYSPCTAAFSAIRRELGTVSALLVFLYQTGLAWLISFGIYQIGWRILG